MPHRVYWSHRRTDELEGGCQYVAMQRMAHAAGLAFLDEESHLSLHPKLGSWFSLRCCVVFDDVAWEAPAPTPLCDPLCAVTRHYVSTAIQTAIHCAERRVRGSLELQRRASLDSAGSGARAGCSARSRSQPPALPGRRCSGRAGAGAAPTAAALLAAAGILEEEPQPDLQHTPEKAGPGAAAAGEGSPRAVTESSGSACSSRRCSGEVGAPAPAGSAASEYGFAVHDAHVAQPPPKPTMDAVRSTWRKWLAVRDAPCPGACGRMRPAGYGSGGGLEVLSPAAVGPGHERVVGPGGTLGP